MGNKLSPFALAAVGMFWLAQAQAVIDAYSCNNCSEAQYANKAQSIAQQYNLGTPLSPYAYVYDKTRGNFRKYSVEREPIPGGYEYIVESISPTTAETNTWTQIDTAMAANGEKSTFFVNLDAVNNPNMPDRSSSVFDFARTSAFQNDMSDWLKLGPAPPTVTSIGLTTAAVFNLAGAIFLHSDVISITVTIYTVDHGRMEFHWTAGETHFSLIGAIDVNNNNVPIVDTSIPGQYRLRTGSSGPFFDYLNNQFHSQITIYGPNTCINGMFACTGDGNHNYSCQWVTCGGVP
jgi:hypothetical protein